MNPKKSSKLYRPLAEELSVSEDLVEDIIQFYYKTLRLKLSNLEAPRINVEGLGHFVIKPVSVRNAITKYTKVLDNHDTSTYSAYFNKKMLETKLNSLIEIEKKICEQEQVKRNFKKSKDENSTESNLGE
jgi:nucleoid DNA-binding protein